MSDWRQTQKNNHANKIGGVNNNDKSRCTSTSSTNNKTFKIVGISEYN